MMPKNRMTKNLMIMEERKRNKKLTKEKESNLKNQLMIEVFR
jgi:hypothetical protein